MFSIVGSYDEGGERQRMISAVIVISSAKLLVTFFALIDDRSGPELPENPSPGYLVLFEVRNKIGHFETFLFLVCRDLPPKSVNLD